ncbi:Barstar, ribonuclease (Barnase) inhibitor [Campylobacter blaseri]|uniref:Barstar (barnase inhibitor) domain-containing protein n=1 Tax=Campylobacter blaseri TaxID=2042961 RepID=A0A2P8R463_9BACT|nr:barstar family protein [Campylobacter blaseri]PSM53281.1 hypothetical protein CQ405_01685 [Campylobacter blaseri]PSM54747.1 hypothetical protein CRN67_01685 [Campylobacter blaseri]QKF86771.1 Barstar, ribonuclease (Barnase) inhibitor [Campylobacter blaseri]
MKKIVIDGRFIKHETDVHRYLIKKFKFPVYYGKNLDALWDSLNEIDEKTTIVLKNPDIFRKNYKNFDALLSLFNDLKNENELIRFEIKTNKTTKKEKK